MSRDLRKYSKQTNTQLVVGAVLLLFLVGLGLIWAIYGFGAAVTGLLCILAAFIPIGLIFIALYGLDWIVKRANPDEDRNH
ncbi:MAG TPA: hypothetical protein PK078_07730 [Anaerolineales bacterium]|nr:hypothetical protein [Anaerolineales bacterium]HNA89289.1 hypothetical protein [Anaerolineales bacterium]HNB36771.1 hypothetical protein [Anaerolineales bacterium]HNC08273.1 hypothetical protein [Anaerolineales bacterium]